MGVVARRFFWFIAPHATFSASMSLFDMFAGFYLFRFGTSSYLAPLAFASAGWIMVPASQGLAARLSRRVSLASCLRLGAIGTGLTLACLGLFAIVGLPWWSLVPIGLVYGSVRSLYGSARNQLDFHIARAGRSDRYFGFQQAAATTASTALGMLAGSIVTYFPAMGYGVVFGLGASLFLATALLVRHHPTVNGSFSFCKLRAVPARNPAFRRVFLASVFRGVSGLGTLPLAIQLFVFSALKQEFPVAGLSGMGAVLALIAGCGLSAFVRPGHRRSTATVASVALFGLGIALALVPTGFLGSIYLLLSPIASVMLLASTSAADMTIISNDTSIMAESVVAREIGLAIGRVGSALPLMFLISDPRHMSWYLVLMSLAYPLQVQILLAPRPALARRVPALRTVFPFSAFLSG